MDGYRDEYVYSVRIACDRWGSCKDKMDMAWSGETVLVFSACKNPIRYVFNLYLSAEWDPGISLTHDVVEQNQNQEDRELC